MGSDFIIRTRLAKMAKKGTIYDYLTKNLANRCQSQSLGRELVKNMIYILN